MSLTFKRILNFVFYYYYNILVCLCKILKISLFKLLQLWPKFMKRPILSSAMTSIVQTGSTSISLAKKVPSCKIWWVICRSRYVIIIFYFNKLGHWLHTSELSRLCLMKWLFLHTSKFREISRNFEAFHQA